MTVTVISPIYNGLYLLQKNLSHVVRVLNVHEHMMKSSIELLLIDDASSDASVEYIEKFLNAHTEGVTIRLLRNESNLGFAPTINKAVKQAKGEYVYLLNSDVTPEEGFLQPLLKKMKDEKVFAVGSMDKSIEKGKEILRGRGQGRWERGFLIHSRGEVDKKDTLWVSGGSGLYRRRVWEKLGGFNELYAPYYWEDIDLSYRALKSGYKVLFEPESVVVHTHSEGAIVRTQSKDKVQNIAHRNMWMFVWLNATDKEIIQQHISWLPYHLIKAVIRGDRYFIHGFFLAFLQLAKILQLRAKAVKGFKRRDSDVVAGY